MMPQASSPFASACQARAASAVVSWPSLPVAPPSPFGRPGSTHQERPLLGRSRWNGWFRSTNGRCFRAVLRRLLHRTARRGTFDVSDLAACVLLPDIHHVIELGDVALLVVGDVAEHGFEIHAGMHHLADLL